MQRNMLQKQVCPYKMLFGLLTSLQPVPTAEACLDGQKKI